MARKNLEKLRNQHRQRFKGKEGSSTQPAKSEQKNRRNILSQQPQNANIEHKQRPASSLNRQEKAKKSKNSKLKEGRQALRFSRKWLLLVIPVATVLLLFLLEKADITSTQIFGNPAATYITNNPKALDWTLQTIEEFPLESISGQNLSLDDFIEKYGQAQDASQSKVSDWKLLTMSYPLQSSGFLIIQFSDINHKGYELMALDITTFSQDSQEKTDEDLEVLLAFPKERETGATYQEVSEKLGRPTSLRKYADEKTYLSFSYEFKNHGNYYLTFEQGEDQLFHLYSLSSDQDS